MEVKIKMVTNYKLDAEDEKILNELDNLCGVVQNKEILKDMIVYTKLKQNNVLNFGNYNIIIRNDSSYNLLNGLLKVCAKIFMKYNILVDTNPLGFKMWAMRNIDLVNYAPMLELLDRNYQKEIE